jgi:hypothetical protein
MLELIWKQSKSKDNHLYHGSFLYCAVNSSGDCKFHHSKFGFMPKTHRRPKNLILQCSPMSVAWTPSRFPVGCVNIVAMNLSHTAINLVTDAMVFALPLVLVLKSSIKPAEKSKDTSNFPSKHHH